MIDTSIFENNKDYKFFEDEHVYYWKDKKVQTSVTKFIGKYFKEFDTEGISYMYAKKHNMLQEDVKKMWKESGDISAMAGTIVHAYLEANKKGLVIHEDYSKASKAGLESEVYDRVRILMPKAEKFAIDTKDLLIPLATEYTVGLEDKLAGNIDLLAWNNEDNEIQIWDYKNLKAMSKTNNYDNCFKPFNDLPDCNFIHYSMQLSFYKALIQRMLGIQVGKLKLVHFNYTTKGDNYKIHEALDLSELCSLELEKLKPSIIINNGILGPIPF